MSIHSQSHGLASTDDHAPGTDGTVVGTVAAAVVEVPFAPTATADTLAQRDASGEVACASPTATDSAATKGYVDSLAAGLSWKDPVSVPNIISDADESAATPAGVTGDARVVHNWAAPWDDDDGVLVEYSGAAWVAIVPAAGGFVPVGTRALVTHAAAAGGLATHEDEVATADGAGGWTFEVPSDGDACEVFDSDSIYDQYVFVNDTTNGWTKLYTIGGNHNLLDAIDGGQVGEYFHLTLAQHTLLVLQKATVVLAGAAPAVGDFAGWAEGNWAFAYGTGGAIYLLARINATNTAVQLGAV